MTYVKSLILLALLVVLVTMAACGGAQPTAAPAPATDAGQTASAPWNADGTVSDGEYSSTATVQDMQIWWRNDGDNLYMAMEAPTSGWVSVGLDPENRMQGANFILGAVVDGEAQIWDAYGQGPVGATHPPDTEIGGSDDVIASAGVEEGDTTLFEFSIPLDSGDEADKPLSPGETYPVILGYAPDDGFDERHSFRGTTEITLEAVE